MMTSFRRLLPIWRIEWFVKREAPTNFTHVCVTTGNLLAGVTFLWGAIKYFDAKAKDVERAETKAAWRSIDACTADARKDNPRVELQSMKRHMLENFDRAARERGWAWTKQPAGVDELADRWLRKRNEGLGWAIEVDGQRTRMKNLWFSIQQAWARHPSRRELLNDLLFGEYPLGREVALKSLLMLEPLDRAACRANESKTGPGICDWENHCPSIYPFIRKVYGIAPDWPPQAELSAVKSKKQLATMVDRRIVDRRSDARDAPGAAAPGAAGDARTVPGHFCAEAAVDERKDRPDATALRQCLVQCRATPGCTAVSWYDEHARKDWANKCYLSSAGRCTLEKSNAGGCVHRVPKAAADAAVPDAAVPPPATAKTAPAAKKEGDATEPVK